MEATEYRKLAITVERPENNRYPDYWTWLLWNSVDAYQLWFETTRPKVLESLARLEEDAEGYSVQGLLDSLDGSVSRVGNDAAQELNSPDQPHQRSLFDGTEGFAEALESVRKASAEAAEIASGLLAYLPNAVRVEAVLGDRYVASPSAKTQPAEPSGSQFSSSADDEATENDEEPAQERHTPREQQSSEKSLIKAIEKAAETIGMIAGQFVLMARQLGYGYEPVPDKSETGKKGSPSIFGKLARRASGLISKPGERKANKDSRASALIGWNDQLTETQRELFGLARPSKGRAWNKVAGLALGHLNGTARDVLTAYDRIALELTKTLPKSGQYYSKKEMKRMNELRQELKEHIKTIAACQ